MRDSDTPSRGDWSEAGVWEGEGLRREAFFFDSGRGERLFGSIYRAAEPTRPDGIVICPSWGVEADRSSKLVYGLAYSVAGLGGTAFVYDHPGYGDSGGDSGESTIESLTGAAVDATHEAARRVAGLDWALAGFTFGAAVACLAQRHCPVGTLLLLQPELRPGSYFREIAHRAEHSSFGKESERLAFGYPAPQAILDRAAEADAAVASANAEFSGGGLAALYEAPEPGCPPPASLERVTVSGRWRFGARSQPGLREAAVAWLKERPGPGGGGR